MTQYPFIKEYTLNHNNKAPINLLVYSLIKGYWALWGAPRKEPYSTVDDIWVVL